MILLLPAYGRTYETVEAMEVDWKAGKDFRILNGPYCSIRDVELLSGMGHDVVLMCGNIGKFIQKGN